jgi:hypothetical protein
LSFNIPLDSDPANRPIYGFLANEQDLNHQFSEQGYGELNPYGNLIVRFKTEVKDNATMTVDDSLGASHLYKEEHRQVASPVNSINRKALPNPAQVVVNHDARDNTDIIDLESSGANDFRTPRYFEWQSGGKMALNDIEEIYMPLNVYYEFNAKELKELENLGIEIKIIMPRA